MRSDAFRWFARGSALAFGAALTFAILYVLVLGATVIVLVFIALLLASALEPLIVKIRNRTPLQRGASLLLVYLLFFVGLAALVLLIVPGAINQFSDVGSKVGPLLDNARSWASTLEPKPVGIAITGLVDSVAKAIQPSSVEAPDPDQLLQIGFTAAEAVISIVSVLTLMYFWLTERARLQRFALALVPADRRQGTREAWNQIELRLGGWVRGQLILMGFVGVTTTIAYFLIGLQGPLLLGVLAALSRPSRSSDRHLARSRPWPSRR
jgi:predicted PurR-regulated permease PerM